MGPEGERDTSTMPTPEKLLQLQGLIESGINQTDQTIPETSRKVILSGIAQVLSSGTPGEIKRLDTLLKSNLSPAELNSILKEVAHTDKQGLGGDVDLKTGSLVPTGNLIELEQKAADLAKRFDQCKSPDDANKLNTTLASLAGTPEEIYVLGRVSEIQSESGSNSPIRVVPKVGGGYNLEAPPSFLSRISSVPEVKRSQVLAAKIAEQLESESPSVEALKATISDAEKQGPVDVPMVIECLANIHAANKPARGPVLDREPSGAISIGRLSEPGKETPFESAVLELFNRPAQ